MALANLRNDSPNGLLDLVRYLKTEHGYEVEVEALYGADGKPAFYERDGWDFRGYPFEPSLRERQFADFLRGRPPQTLPAHLNLDEEASQDVVAAWIAEPESITHGMETLNRAIRMISLSNIDGEYFLAKVARAVEVGRNLARESSASTRGLSRLLQRWGLLDQLIARWLLSVHCLVAAMELHRLQQGDKLDDAA